MRVEGKNYKTIWIKEDDDATVSIIDQRCLPHHFVIENLRSVADVVRAIKDMHVRGAGLIGAAAGYGMWLGAIEAGRTASFQARIYETAYLLRSARPTAVNPEIAVARQLAVMANADTVDEKINLAKLEAIAIADEDVEFCRNIGIHGLKIIEEISKAKGRQTVNILTHCNAGWLAFVDYGSATSPIYEAFENNIKVHVWVDETRPRNQGSALTAWELLNHGVPHTIITDNAGGHLMQHGLVDVVITGADRVTRTGDVANKIGTYLKALAAFDNKIPFYVALPSSTFDWKIRNGLKEINIEERSSDEVKYVYGLCDNEMKEVLLAPKQSTAMNYGFDITPSRLISGLITERGICAAKESEIANLFPDRQ